MRIRGQGGGTGGEVINLSSLIDVLFILIIFFLAATRFEEEERDIPVNLPDAADGQRLSAAPKVEVINVLADGSYALGSRPIELPALRRFLEGAVEADPGQRVLVRADENARHGRVAAAVLACKRAGINEANIGYHLPR